MGARKSFHVVPSGARWDVMVSGIAQATFATRQGAEAAALAMARKNKPAEIVIHRPDGTVESTHAVGDEPTAPRT